MSTPLVPPNFGEECIPKVVREWPYQSEHVLVVPLAPNGPLVFPDDFLVGLYLQLKRDGLLETTLPGMAPYTLNRFVQYFADKAMVVVVAKPAYNEVAGFGWLYNAEGPEGRVKAFVGVGFFRRNHGQPIVREAAELALRWWFNELQVEVLFGMTLASNMLASNYGRKVGFEAVATVPNWFVVDGQFRDGRLLTMTKARFEALRGNVTLTKQDDLRREADRHEQGRYQESHAE